ncbi:MAG: RagB/SusD family nutrient uptake outer membrane protein [Niabella sp.]
MKYFTINNKFKMLLACIMLAFGSFSCNKDFLDVSKELAEELNEDDIFGNASYARQFQRNIFSGIPMSTNMIINVTGLQNPWAGMTDELKMAQGPLRNLTSNGYNAGNADFHRWTTLYQLIRQANLFLEKGRVIPQTGSADYIDEAELKKMKAQAKFLRAYYHYLLFEQYGPIPIMDKAADPNAADLDFARNSVDEVVNFIDKELAEVLPDLNPIETDQNFLALPTQGAALAVRARLWIYAASPLLNGGYAEALNVQNPEDGKKLFPAADPSKWAKAVQALQQLIDFANAGNYELYKELRADGSINADNSLYNLFIKYNNEIIWATPNNGWGSLSSGESLDRRCTPRSIFSGFNCIAVTQELVDDFFMNDGLSIQESPLYSETGFSAAGEDPTGRTETGTFRMWVKREPRFYQTVFYHGRRWHINNAVVKFNKGNGNDNSAADYPWSGYLMYKRASRAILNTGSNPKSEYRSSIIFRLAEFYLLYAEALNETNPSDPRIIEYVDKVRERAGIPKLADIKPEIKGNKDLQREAIHREMRVELATEGQRYFDVRRWMIAEKTPGEGGQGGAFYGMNMNANTESDFFKRTTYETRTFIKAMYLYPLPLNEIQKSKKLVQNPGW